MVKKKNETKELEDWEKVLILLLGVVDKPVSAEHLKFELFLLQKVDPNLLEHVKKLKIKRG